MSSVTEHFDRQAKEAIEEGIRQAEGMNQPIDRTTARMIAACIHGGPSTPLHIFAARGQLDREAARIEMDISNYPPRHGHWVAALWDYLDRPQPRHRGRRAV